uniref:uncharacterized protein LOC120326469 n=1 Tax=Styela clava TaxID=7725 RepID=UPI0019392C79|nr:uncharacterized protein LOC120326469 [Styela clava]
MLLIIAVSIIIVFSIRQREYKIASTSENTEKTNVHNASFPGAQIKNDRNIYESNIVNKRIQPAIQAATSGYEIPISDDHFDAAIHPDPIRQMGYLMSNSLQQPDGSSEYEPTNLHHYYDIEY